MGRARKYEVGDVFRQGYGSYKKGKLLPQSIKQVAKDIIECRTSKLGGHKQICKECKAIKISYNSCKNRHCPKCQFSKREQWVLDRNRDLLPVSYFHVIFTLPHELNGLHKKYPKQMYDLLFKSARKSMQSVIEERWKESVQLGMICVLHTWGQTLGLHPHLHCIIPSGVYRKNKHKWSNAANPSKLCSIERLTSVYKETYLNNLTQLKKEMCFKPLEKAYWDNKIQACDQKVFNVNIQPSFKNPDHVIEYIGRYSHRVAITNSRIRQIKDGQVLIDYKDYRDGKDKVMTLSDHEFIRRFLLHVLPKGFMKIRHYGLLSNRIKNEMIEVILIYLESSRNPKHKFDPVKYFLERHQIDLRVCDQCGSLKSSKLYLIPKARSDPDHFNEN